MRNMFESGTFLHSIWRGFQVFLVFGITTVFAQNPQWADVTIGSLAFIVVHYFEGKLTA